jgi:hypothetical protein
VQFAQVVGQAMALADLPPMYSTLVLDIETTDASPEAADKNIIEAYRPESFGSWKPETIGARIKDAWEKRKAHLALLNEAPIIVVSLKADCESPRVLHCMREQAPAMFPADHPVGLVEGFADCRGMLIALRNLLDQRCDSQTIIGGHNILDFDLRKLRWAYLRHGLHLPNVLLDSLKKKA